MKEIKLRLEITDKEQNDHHVVFTWDSADKRIHTEGSAFPSEVYLMQNAVNDCARHLKRIKFLPGKDNDVD